MDRWTSIVICIRASSLRRRFDLIFMSLLVLRAMSERIDVIQQMNRNHYLSQRKPTLLKKTLDLAPVR